MENTFGFPVSAQIFRGAIIAIPPAECSFCYAEAGDNYKKIAARFGVSAEAVEKLNCCRPVLPTAKVWLP